MAVLIAGGMAACDNGEDPNEDGHFYCTDSSGTVIDEDYCDDSDGGDSSGFFFMYMGSSMHYPPSGYSSYPVGSKMPTAAPRFSVSDKVARTRYGLPATGKISNGTVKTGVIGKGGAGSSLPKVSSGGGSKGGSGVGGKSGSSGG